MADRRRSKPLGVKSYTRWYRDRGRRAGLADLVARYAAVSAAVDRYRRAGVPVPVAWLAELGV